MTTRTRGYYAASALTLTTLTLATVVGCATSVTTAPGSIVTAQDQPEYTYMLIEEFDTDMGEFIGLVEGESFNESVPKINAVFTAYDGHAEPQDITMLRDVVEGGWTQVLVTQDGVMDDTIAGHQLLAIYDENGELVTYGMRLKCHTDSGKSEWQKTAC